MQVVFTHKRYPSISNVHTTSTSIMLDISYKKHGQMFSDTKLTLSATSGKNLTVFLNPPPFPVLHITITFVTWSELEKYIIRDKNQKAI